LVPGVKTQDKSWGINKNISQSGFSNPLSILPAVGLENPAWEGGAKTLAFSH